MKPFEEIKVTIWWKDYFIVFKDYLLSILLTSKDIFKYNLGTVFVCQLNLCFLGWIKELSDLIYFNS